jgi:NAD(P)-dependent dehydrogenase (short-subunit alcohol dehydrogenase family)
MKNNKKIALITGSNKGIGLETARQLGKQEITVLIGARDPKKSEVAGQLRQEARTPARSDRRQSNRKHSEAVEQVNATLAGWTSLINNAGIGIDDHDKR